MRDTFELLAPAGSFDSFKAAINAGADAIYLGGSMFGARAFANNFKEEELIKALSIAHRHDKKIFMTVNTLLKEDELYDSLYSFLKPYYENGLDGVIVQDLGVVSAIRNLFPQMLVHASTQMSIAGVETAKWLKSQGVSRVVPARELTIDEIKRIYDETGLEIESFVHGALCYCYSGQCLLSSLLGNRSGNRGQCAQPCRLMYKYNDKNAYFLSPKDMCTIDILPHLLDNGVYSMKIEGRMKSPQYTAGVVSIYRKYIDMYLEKGSKDYRVDENDRIALMDLYNRGGFNQGYYESVTGKSMMSIERPNHAGTNALKVAGREGNKVVFKAELDVKKGDVFEITSDFNITTGVDVKKGQSLKIQIPSKFNLKNGQIVRRIKNTSLIDLINSKYIGDVRLKKAIDASMYFNPGDNAILTLSSQVGEEIVYSSVTGDIVEESINKPATRESLEKQIGKLADSPFKLSSFEADMNNGFMPLSKLNDLRRNACEQLELNINQLFNRTANACNLEVPSNNTNARVGKISVSVLNMSQLKAALGFGYIDRIYVDYKLLDASGIDELINSACCDIYVTTPHILRENKKKQFNSLIDKAKNLKIKGFLCRNIESALVIKSRYSDLVVIGDSQNYCWNSSAKAALYNIFDELTLPVELKKNDLDKFDCTGCEMIVYGYPFVMVSAQCVKKTNELCDKANGVIIISDRKNAHYKIQSNCEYCQSVMYYHSPIELDTGTDCPNGVNYRFDFTFEDEQEVIRRLEEIS